MNGSGSRTPVDLSIDLAEDLDLAGKYRPVLVENSFDESALFEWHACSRQPMFYLATNLVPSGRWLETIWSELASRGFRYFTRPTQTKDINTVPQFERLRIAAP
jgi:hypothetical protein